MKMKGKQMLIGLLIIAVGIAIDQITKYLAFRHLEFGREYKCIPGLFRFELVKNPGGAWGIFANQLWFFIIVTVVALVFLGFLARQFDLKENPVFSVAFILITTGTLGNFIDRVVYRGEVRDFVTFDFMSFPSFNFADMALTIGVILLAIDILFGKTGAVWTKSD
jgi:signal peptidase II